MANRIKALLESQLEVGVFLSSDTTQIFAGDSWLEKITTALKEANLVLLMLSQRSLRRPWVNFEAGGAWLLGKTVIPCCYGNLTAHRLPHPYSNAQAVHLPKDALYLVQSVHHQLGMKTPLPVSPVGEALAAAVSKKRKAIWGGMLEPYTMLANTLGTFVDESANPTR